MKSKFFLVITFFLMIGSEIAKAESISLSTGEIVEGSLIDFPKDVTIQLPDGTKKTVPYIGITSIYKNTPPQSFTPFLNKDNKGKNEKPSFDKMDDGSFSETDETKGPYGTPTLTFQTWKKAALLSDIDAMSDCYSSYRKNDVKKDLKKISKRVREDMKTALVQTIFSPSIPYYQGDSAIMEVTWTKGLASQTQTLKFVLENNKDWKIAE